MKTIDRRNETDPAREALATRLANDIINCDPSILSLLILDNFGKKAGPFDD